MHSLRPDWSRFSVPALLMLASSGVSPAPTAAAVGQAAGEQQRPGFGAEVARVRVDVVVTDRDGEFADDLAAEDFVVFEDGIPQEVLQVLRVDLLQGVVRELQRADGRGFPVNAVGADVAAPEVGADDRTPEALGTVVFAIDFGALGYRERRRFARAWADLFQGDAPLRMPYAAYNISGGGLRELAPLTDRVEVLRAASEVLLKDAGLSEGEEPSSRPSLSRRLWQLLA